MITVVLLAAGKGERTALIENKIKYKLNDKPVFMHSYERFKKMGFKVITVIQKEDEDFILKHIDDGIVYGGSTRAESVYQGLKEVDSKYVLIHDGARPFIQVTIIQKLIESLKQYNASMVCKKATSTMYNKDLEVIDRDDLVEGETPQAFLTSKIKEAYELQKNFNFTDDISLYRLTYPDEDIGLIYHETNNEKITTTEAVKKYFNPFYKIGHSYDIHQIDKTRKLILGGILIDAEFGLLGHSDADVLLHAISESILGALGLGDLGTHFPDTDLKYKDLDSKEILIYAKNKCLELGFEIVNIDASIYAEEPKLAPYMNKIKENIAKILSINGNQINIKAGTNEKMDAVGKKEAIASEAVCMLKGYEI